jgi:hypothetical protein
MAQSLKLVGPSGQISLGKKYAGKTVLIESPEEGVWVIKTALAIPESELWLHTPEASERLGRAMAYAEANPAQESNLDALAKRLSAKRPKVKQ